MEVSACTPGRSHLRHRQPSALRGDRTALHAVRRRDACTSHAVSPVSGRRRSRRRSPGTCRPTPHDGRAGTCFWMRMWSGWSSACGSEAEHARELVEREHAVGRGVRRSPSKSCRSASASWRKRAAGQRAARRAAIIPASCAADDEALLERLAHVAHTVEVRTRSRSRAPGRRTAERTGCREIGVRALERLRRWSRPRASPSAGRSGRPSASAR